MKVRSVHGMVDDLSHATDTLVYLVRAYKLISRAWGTDSMGLSWRTELDQVSNKMKYTLYIPEIDNGEKQEGLPESYLE